MREGQDFNLVSAGDSAACHADDNFLFVSEVNILVYLLMFAKLLQGGACRDIRRTRVIPEGSTANLSGQAGFDAGKEIVLRISLGKQQ